LIRNGAQVVRDYLVCEADFPTEGGWIGDRPDEANPPGKELVDFLHTALQDHTSGISEVWNEEGYGWSFNCEREGVTVNILLQRLDHWLIIFSIVSLVPRFLRSSRYETALTAICEQVKKIIRSDCRFRDIRWFTRTEYDAFGRAKIS
jgi:hypothetical protein